MDDIAVSPRMIVLRTIRYEEPSKELQLFQVSTISS